MEKSSRKHRDERDSGKDNYRDSRDHRYRIAKDGRSKESEELHHSDKYREEKHHRSNDYEETKVDRFRETRNGREGSRERERERGAWHSSVEKYSSRDYGEGSHELRTGREGSRERGVRPPSVEKHVLRDYGERSHEVRRGREGSRERGARQASVEKYSSRDYGEGSHELRNGREGSRERGVRPPSVEKHVLRDYGERSHEPRRGREGSRERGARQASVEKYSSRDHRERSREPRDKREGSNDHDESVDRQYSKRKHRADSEDRLDKSEKRRKEDRKERRRFEDTALEDSRILNGAVKEEKREDLEFEDRSKEEQMRDLDSGTSRNGKRERRKFGDRVKKEDRKYEEEEKNGLLDVKYENKVFRDERVNNSSQRAGSSHRSSSTNDGAEPQMLNTKSRDVSEPSQERDRPPPTKVSSISITNENKGVSVTRSHEVPGQSSTDGTTAPAAGNSGGLSLDSLAIIKRALQKQKDVSEKLKKVPALNRARNTISDGTQHAELSKEGSTIPSPSMGTQTFPSASTLPAMTSASASGMSALTGLENNEAVKRAQELAAKMGFRHDPEFAPVINMFPGQMATDVSAQQKPSKAPVLRLDQYGNAIDEHGNVINLSKAANLSTLKVNINKQKKDAFQILKPELDVDPESNPHFDERMGINKEKLLRPKRMSFQFVEEGQWSKQAEIMRFKSQFGEAQAKELKTKQAQLAKAKAEPDINPNLIELSERVVTREKPKDPIPEVEWWDVPFLVSGKYGDVVDGNINEDNLNMDKITIYVEHPRPIEPPAEPAPPLPQPLKLTKKEQKKLRTQRRLAKEKDRQEMIRQGLIEPPKAKVKMSNLMKVLGSEATQDPTRLEMEIRSAAAEREQAHVDRNIARKLLPAERREKKERKLFEDPNTLETIVSVYKINDLSHPQTRFKVDVNAQENRLTGTVVIADSMTVVVVEGGSKPIKRYGKLMLRRINWATAVADDNDEDENEDKPLNKCSLVWQGSVAKPNFNKFLVHQCRTEAAARKVFSDAGVAHYWDLAVNFVDDQM